MTELRGVPELSVMELLLQTGLTSIESEQVTVGPAPIQVAVMFLVPAVVVSTVLPEQE